MADTNVTTKNKFTIQVTPNLNGRDCFIDWGDGARTVCYRKGEYVHEYADRTADYNCAITNAYEFSIGSDDKDDYSKELVNGNIQLEEGLGRIPDDMFNGIPITYVNIPNSVESIGSRAFSGCTELRTANFPESLTSLGEYAFDGCENVTITNSNLLSSSSITSIPDACFRNCKSLNKMSLPDTVTTVGASAFYDTNLQFNNFPKNLTDVGDYAFYFFSIRGWLPDNTLYFDSHVNRIGDYAFYYFTGLDKIYSSKGIDYIGSHAFADCRYLNTVQLSGDVGTISDNCFSFNLETERYELKNVGFYGNVDEIGDYAFALHTGLRRVEIPSGIRKIGDAAFMECNNLSVVQNDGVVANSLESIGASAFYNRSYHYLSSFSVGDSLTSIGDYAFCSCNKLSSFNFGDKLEYIGNSSFNGCTNLLIGDGNLECPENLSRIGEYAFTGCSYITSVDFNDALNEIPKGLFSGSSLVTANIGNGVKTIGDNSFRGCSKLETLNFGSSLKTIGSVAFSNCTKLSDVILPNTVEDIGYGAFLSNTALSSLYLSESLTSISDYAFSSCRSVASLNLPNKLNSIGNYAFGGLSSLKTLQIPDSVEWIGNRAFVNARNLENVSFGSSLKHIGDYAFSRATTYDTPTPLSNLTLNDGLTSIGVNCFEACGSLGGHVYIPHSVSSIGNGAFMNTRYGSITINANISAIPTNCFCKSSITVFNLPQSVEIVGNGAFSSCRTISSINIPSSCRTIGNGAFVYCSSLKYLKFENPTPPTVEYNSFGYSSYNSTWIGYGLDIGDKFVTIPNGSSINYHSQKWYSSIVGDYGYICEEV